MILSTAVPAVFVLVIAYKLPPIRFVLIGMLLFYTAGLMEFHFTDTLNSGRFSGYAGKQVVVKGVIDSEPDIRENSINYIVKTSEIMLQGEIKKVKGRIILTTLKDESSFSLGYGREVEISGQINVPKGRRNPGGFDYRRYLAGKGISAAIFATGNSIHVGENYSPNVLVKTGFFLRNSIVDVINRSLPPQQAGLLNGMLIGYREGLSTEVQNAFSDAGLSHIMAVSGANVAFIVAPLVFMFRRLRIRQKIANISIIGVLMLFVFITGFSPSVMRAVIMAVIILAGRMIRREAEVITSISLAAVLMLIYNPFTFFDIGFQLSFAATLSLVLFYKNIKKMLNCRFIPGFITELLAVTLAAQVGVIPITALYFNKISIISLFSNLAVVPVVELITLLGSAMALLGQISIVFSQVIGYVNSTFLSFVLYVSKTSASMPFAVVKAVTPPIAFIVIYYFLAMFFLWYKPLSKVRLKPVYYGTAFAGILLAACLYMIIPRGLEVVFIDVGEGDSTFIKTYSGRTVLIDGGGSISKGGKEPDGPNVGDTTVIPFLLDYGVTSLDLVVATHGHDDHIQGLIPVLKSFKAGNLVMPDIAEKKELKPLIAIAEAKGVLIRACTSGDRIRLDDRTYFDVLNPDSNPAGNKISLNNSSLVLKLHYKTTSILFSGDVEQETENFLLESKSDIKADILKVAHHGSGNSTTPAFIDRVQPGAAVISVGKNNFGHPSKKVLETLKSKDVRLFRTDEDGAVILKSNGERISISKMVQSSFRTEGPDTEEKNP